MKKLTKLILSLALVLTVLASATNYQAAEKATADMVNGYDWNGASVDHIYIFAADDTQSVNSINGQTGNTFEWWHIVLLEEGADGVCTVIASEVGSANKIYDSKLGQGKMALMAHSTTAKADDFAFLSSLKVGDKVKLSNSFDELVGLQWGSTVSVSIEKAAASAGNSGTTTTTPDAGSNNAGSNNAGSNNAGSNVPSTGDATPVVAMASMLFVAVAFVALGLKKRNA